ncbi:uncharacterized protein PRCAT00000912001 [Priceomyces carsonii]|uniref:uncharacterized protein n=1 Tax=Priceomyces carsonii TaxID=28549 RepID=UPI002ED7DCA6|nr:unnamed protein product [Priceomyces carsonii]
MSPPSKQAVAEDTSAASTKLSDKVTNSTQDSILKYTDISDIPKGVEKLRESFFNKQKTLSIQYRLNQLRNVYFIIKDNVDEICAALEKDFHRSVSETKLLEIHCALSELVHTMANIHKWAKKEPVTDVPVAMKTSPIYIEKCPLGVVLIISPFNYPFLLSLNAITGALGAGNAVVFKPSEATPHFSQLFCDLLSEVLDDDIFFAVNGAVPETTALLDQKFDKIMYTGNNFVGTIVAKKAAETLTPVILELGGKSPTFVLDDVLDKDIPVIARRIVWGRFTNGGQTCVAVDYVLAHQSIKDKLVKEIVKVINEEFYPKLTASSPDYTHLIHDKAFSNIKSIIQKSKGKLVTGGQSDSATNFVAPTVFDDVDWSDATMQQEIFGPVLPILTYTDLKTAIKNVVRYHDTPLAQYIFTSGSTKRENNKQINAILSSIRSGSTVINDVVVQAALSGAPFGGVGNSGYGAYHGVISFRAFSHERTTMEQKLWNDFALASRYPPYNAKKDRLLESSLTEHNDKVWFGRSGNVKVKGPGFFFNLWTGIAGVATLGYYFATS